MITLLLLPFFLASRVSVNVDSWRQYGPIYTYRVNIGILAWNTGETPNRGRSFIADAMLICRPRLPNALNCRFEGTKLVAGPELLRKAFDDGLASTLLDEKPFEIEFDRNGVRVLIVHRNIEPRRINLIKRIVGQLNLGVDLRHVPDGKFTTFERSINGNCETSIEISRRGTINWQASTVRKDFEILPIAGFRKARGETLEIAKRRNLSRCRRKKRPWRVARAEEEKKCGTTFRKVFGKADKGYTITFFSSHSRILVSDVNFTSYAVDEFFASYEDKNVTLREKIMVNLESVTPANEELSPMSNTMPVSFFVRKDGCGRWNHG